MNFTAKKKTSVKGKNKLLKVGILLFDDFETLDVFGPVEVIGRLTDIYNINFYSQNGAHVSNYHGVTILTDRLEQIDKNLDVFIIPGGLGTRKEVFNEELINRIKEISNTSRHVLTICTGSALLAKTGLLDGKNATSNKKSLSWVITNGGYVLWNKKDRWTVDDKYYTSSGVSAGIDMTLAFVKDIHGQKVAKRIAREIEYTMPQLKS